MLLRVTYADWIGDWFVSVRVLWDAWIIGAPCLIPGDCHTEAFGIVPAGRAMLHRWNNESARMDIPRVPPPLVIRTTTRAQNDRTRQLLLLLPLPTLLIYYNYHYNYNCGNHYNTTATATATATPTTTKKSKTTNYTTTSTTITTTI